MEVPQVDPAQFARSVADTSDENLAEGMRSEYRGVVLEGIFQGMVDHFEPAKAQDVDAVIHWKIGGRADGGHDTYELVIKDGVCSYSKEPKLDPRLTFTVDGVDFLRLVTGNASGPRMFMFGKLKIEGDLLFAARVQGLFRIPEADSNGAPGTAEPAA
jgi:putative sterol carrier protein